MAAVMEQAKAETGRILVVDDDFGMRDGVLHGLEGCGYHVEGAEDGLQALEHLQHGDFDVVVTDLQMPRLDGLALLREIRRRRYRQAVVIQTTLLDTSLEFVLRRAGASGVLMKGGPLKELVRSVEEACRASHSLRTDCP